MVKANVEVLNILRIFLAKWHHVTHAPDRGIGGLCHLLTLWLWVRYSTSLTFNFLIYTIGNRQYYIILGRNEWENTCQSTLPGSPTFFAILAYFLFLECIGICCLLLSVAVMFFLISQQLGFFNHSGIFLIDISEGPSLTTPFEVVPQLSFHVLNFLHSIYFTDKISKYFFIIVYYSNLYVLHTQPNFYFIVQPKIHFI